MERELLIEAPRRAIEPDALRASDLSDRAARREVPPQYSDMSRALDGVRERAHDVLPAAAAGGGKEVRRVRDVLCEGAARHRQLCAVDEVRSVSEEVFE